MDIIGAVFSMIRMIIGIVLLFFIPGFAFSWVFFPRKESLPDITRIAYSLVLSIACVMLGVLFLDIFLGIDTTPTNIVIIILSLTGIALLIWRVELTYLNSNIRQTINNKVSDEALITLNLPSIRQNFNLGSVRQKIMNLSQRLKKKDDKKTEL